MDLAGIASTYRSVLQDALRRYPAGHPDLARSHFARATTSGSLAEVLCHHAVGHAGGSGATLGVCSAHLSSGKTPDAEEVRAQQVTKLLEPWTGGSRRVGGFGTGFWAGDQRMFDLMFGVMLANTLVWILVSKQGSPVVYRQLS